MRKELAAFARQLAREYGPLFQADPTLKKRVAGFLAALLPPKPRRRGRPGRKDVTDAIRLLAIFKNRFPGDRHMTRWARVYPLAIPGYVEMDRAQRRAEQRLLRDRIRARRNIRKRRKSRYKHPPNCSV